MTRTTRLGTRTAAAGALAAWTLACAGRAPHRLPPAELSTSARAPAPAPAPAPSARADEAAPAPRLAAALSRRLRRVGPDARRRVAHVIRAEARRAGLDPLVVLAVIRVESGFDPDAVSRSGAVGLMQLRPATMREELARARLPAADPRDPAANVRAGVRYLSRLVKAFGALDVGLMAYNAGPGRISRHLREGGIPGRFRRYPERVRAELARLRTELAPAPAGPPAGAGATPALVASAAAWRPPPAAATVAPRLHAGRPLHLRSNTSTSASALARSETCGSSESAAPSPAASDVPFTSTSPPAT